MKRVLSATAVLFFLAGHAAADERSDNVAAGQQLAERLCARCHAIGADGESPFAAAPPFRIMSAKWPIDSLAEAFAEGIVVGHPDMPEFQFEAEDVGALLDYLESVQER